MNAHCDGWFMVVLKSALGKKLGGLCPLMTNSKKKIDMLRPSN